MSRFAEDMNVLYWEEPMDIGPKDTAFLQVRKAEDFPNVTVIVPHLPEGMGQDAREATLKRLLDAQVAAVRGALISWYYTPMMLPFSRHLDTDAVIFDSMDELSKFRFAPENLLQLEQELIDKADLVFTGGSSLYEAKKNRHENCHLFPSSVDREHFAKARNTLSEPEDQANIGRPRLGFYGVIDERFDIELLRQIADMRPDWQFVIVGPVVKISEQDLPRAANIHYVGGKTYDQLPSYLSGWDVALMPFAMNESTQFISPTKTPEYLAGGKPVV
ncbi:MAG: UDP-galactopyranose mutase, partial [Sphingomicrobium sp.]